MKFFSDCSGPCEECYSHFAGGCLAGHGDDDFSQMTEKDGKRLIIIMNKWHLERKGDTFYETSIMGRRDNEFRIKEIFLKYPNLVEWWNNPTDFIIVNSEDICNEPNCHKKYSDHPNHPNNLSLKLMCNGKLAKLKGTKNEIK